VELTLQEVEGGTLLTVTESSVPGLRDGPGVESLLSAGVPA
jgi:hypothetical protein